MTSLPPTDSSTRVLLVDEESSLRKSLELRLRNDGSLVSTAANRSEAVDYVRTSRVDLILLNMLMPGTEGIGTLIAIRSIAPEMKIVAMSDATGDPAARFLPLAKSLGASALLADPLDHGKLTATIRELLEQDLRQLAC